MTFYAHTDRRGVIEFGDHVPEGSLPLFHNEDEDRVRELVGARARHAYDGVTLLVPGVPEADDEDAAYAAWRSFRTWLNSSPRSAS